MINAVYTEDLYINTIHEEAWVTCPLCHAKTRVRIRGDTVLINFPLYCPKCRQKSLINVKQFNISVIKEPDATTQSR